MTGVILLGLAAGGGLCLAITAMAPARPPLAVVIAAATATQPPPVGPTLSGWRRPLTWPAQALQRYGLPRRAARQDLVICGQEPLFHLAALVAVALGGGLAPATVIALISVAAGAVNVLLPLWTALAGAGAAVAVAHLRLRAGARARRAQLRAALSTMLDIVVVALSGGVGLEQALAEATHPRLGVGWAISTLRAQVVAAAHAGTTTWRHLEQLGAATGVTPLADLAAAVALTGVEGAHIRDSLAARAETLRARQAAELKAAARSATQRMILPLMLIGLGYLLFLIFPAIYVLTSSL